MNIKNIVKSSGIITSCGLDRPIQKTLTKIDLNELPTGMLKAFIIGLSIVKISLVNLNYPRIWMKLMIGIGSIRYSVRITEWSLWKKNIEASFAHYK